MQCCKIVADDKIPFLKGVLEPFAEVVYLPGAQITALDVQDADVIFTRTRTKCNEALLGNSPVRLIATATIGYDHIDTDYCDAAGIRWVNAPGCNSGSVQQYITAVLTTLAYQRNLRLSDLTIGVIGVGHVGSKVARIARALGMRVLLNDPPRADREGMEAFTALEQLLPVCDIVTCHTPLTKVTPYPTYHLASDDFFNRMKKGAFFINTSRGPVTDSQALKKAVNTKLSGFVLDVWEGEPVPDDFLLAEAFIATPHIAGYSADGKANGTAACIREFCDCFRLDVLQEWFPSSMPPPPMPVDFSIDGAGKSFEQILFEAVTFTYPVWEDSNRLKTSPETFEDQRGGYWVRREFNNFTIHPENIDKATLDTLKMIGFNILPAL